MKTIQEKYKELLKRSLDLLNIKPKIEAGYRGLDVCYTYYIDHEDPLRVTFVQPSQTLLKRGFSFLIESYTDGCYQILEETGIPEHAVEYVSLNLASKIVSSDIKLALLEEEASEWENTKLDNELL